MLKRSFILLPALLSGCGPSQSADTRTLSLQLLFDGTALDCQQVLTINNQHWKLQQFQLYLSGFTLNDNTLPLTSGPAHQQADIALLGTVCDGTGNWQMQFAKPLSSGQLSFTLGVPAALNHQDPLRAASPLNQSDMFWSWQQGYKYLRLELAGTEQQWALHLGATGCQSPSPMRPPATPCQQPNLARINLNYQSGQTLTLDLAPLLSGISLSADNHCMSDANRLSCQTLLPRLGINAAPVGWSMQ